MESATSTPALPASTSWRKWLSMIAVTVLVALLLYTLRQQLTEVRYTDIVAEIRGIPSLRLLLAVLATAASFLVLTRFDLLSLRHLDARVPPRQVMATSFIAFALGNFLGFGLLTGGAVRARAYLNAGLDTRTIGRLISLNGVAYLLTTLVFGSLALLFNRDDLAQVAPLPATVLDISAGVFLIADTLIVLAFLPGFARWLRHRWQVQLPRPRIAAGFFVAGAFDMALSAAVLWLLLPPGSIGFGSFAAIFTLATALGLASQIPGGVGAFEAVMLSALGTAVPAATLAGALVLYRLIYYGLPLLVATGLVVWYEVLGNFLKPLHQLFIGLAPPFLSLVASLVGIILLISGATPSTDEAAQTLSTGLPLFLVEAAHLFGSIAGLALLFVTRGLLHRQNAAWWIAFISALLGAALALPKGIAVLELALSLVLCLYLFLSRHLFTRHTTLLDASLTPGWWLYTSAVLACCLWLVFFAYRDVQYSHELWWQFEFDGHAPRSLRALMTVSVITLIAALWQLLREPDAPPAPASKEDVEKALAIALASDNPDALLVGMGDKLLHFSDSGQSFIMYGKLGRSWIALFDPVGNTAEHAGLVWDFIDKAERHGGRAAFYEVKPQQLPLYLDAGLKAWKVGECAVVDLPAFDLEGPQRSKLRQALKRGERDGLEFRIAGREELPALFRALQRVSDAWLDAHNTREKSFSLGHFARDYIATQPVALVSLHGEVVAFATLQRTQGKHEISLDLMRYVASAPKSCMDFLFCQLLLHAKHEGYQRFSLGMAPMSGMSQHRLANRWHKLAQFIYTHGERFYNFQGLRAFKQKFAPEWEPRYLVTTPGYLPIMALKDIAVLVSGGLKGVIVK